MYNKNIIIKNKIKKVHVYILTYVCRAVSLRTLQRKKNYIRVFHTIKFFFYLLIIITNISKIKFISVSYIVVCPPDQIWKVLRDIDGWIWWKIGKFCFQFPCRFHPIFVPKVSIPYLGRFHPRFQLQFGQSFW